MAFDRVEVIVKAGRTGLPASVSLSTHERPTFKISLSREFVATHGIKAEDRFDLLLGTGDQKGLARLKRAKTGLLAPHPQRKGGVSFNCGHVERFGSEPEKKQFCKAAAIDADTFEIVLPAWSQEQDL